MDEQKLSVIRSCLHSEIIVPENPSRVQYVCTKTSPAGKHTGCRLAFCGKCAEYEPFPECCDT